MTPVCVPYGVLCAMQASEDRRLLGPACSKTQELVLIVAVFQDSRLLMGGGKFCAKSKTAKRGHLPKEQSSLAAQALRTCLFAAGQLPV